MATADFLSGRPVGAICHGVLVLARSIDPTTGKSVLHDAARQFESGPIALVRRDSEQDANPAFVVADGNYVSARWPGAPTASRAVSRNSSRATAEDAASRRPV